MDFVQFSPGYGEYVPLRNFHSQKDYRPMRLHTMRRSLQYVLHCDIKQTADHVPLPLMECARHFLSLRHGKNQSDYIVIQSALVYAYYLLPLSMIVVCVMLSGRETGNNGILKMLALPVSRGLIFVLFSLEGSCLLFA